VPTMCYRHSVGICTSCANFWSFAILKAHSENV
jgi:hypothetical protein